MTKHPETGEWQEAQWIDNYFGHYNYGVRFDGLDDRTVYDPRKVDLETREWTAEERKAREAVQQRADVPRTETKKTPTGKVAERTEHPDGRVDVKVHIPDSLDLDEDERDEATENAKREIEENVLPKLKETKVSVCLIHAPTGESAQQHDLSIIHVRKWAETAVQAYRAHTGINPPTNEFLVVEYRPNMTLFKVTRLNEYEKE